MHLVDAPSTSADGRSGGDGSSAAHFPATPCQAVIQEDPERPGYRDIVFSFDGFKLRGCVDPDGVFQADPSSLENLRMLAAKVQALSKGTSSKESALPFSTEPPMIAKHVVVTHEVLFLLVHDVVFQFLASPVPVNPASVIPAAQCRGLCLENNILFGLHADGHRMPLAFIDGQQVIYPSLYQRNMHFYDQCAVAPRPDGSLVLCHENALFLLTFSQPAAGAAGSTGVPVVDIRLLFSRASVRLVLFPYFFQSGLMVVTDDTGAVLACGRDDLTCFFESDMSSPTPDLAEVHAKHMRLFSRLFAFRRKLLLVGREELVLFSFARDLGLRGPLDTPSVVKFPVKVGEDDRLEPSLPDGVVFLVSETQQIAYCLDLRTELSKHSLLRQSDFPSRMTISPFWSVRHENAIYFRRSIHNQHVVAAFLSPESPANPARALFTSATEFVFTQPVSKDTQPFTLQSADGTVTKWTDISHSALFQRVAIIPSDKIFDRRTNAILDATWFSIHDSVLLGYKFDPGATTSFPRLARLVNLGARNLQFEFDPAPHRPGDLLMKMLCHQLKITFSLTESDTNDCGFICAQTPVSLDEAPASTPRLSSFHQGCSSSGTFCTLRDQFYSIRSGSLSCRELMISKKGNLIMGREAPERRLPAGATRIFSFSQRVAVVSNERVTFLPLVGDKESSITLDEQIHSVFGLRGQLDNMAIVTSGGIHFFRHQNKENYVPLGGRPWRLCGQTNDGNIVIHFADGSFDIFSFAGGVQRVHIPHTARDKSARPDADRGTWLSPWDNLFWVSLLEDGSFLFRMVPQDRSDGDPLDYLPSVLGFRLKFGPLDTDQGGSDSSDAGNSAPHQDLSYAGDSGSVFQSPGASPSMSSFSWNGPAQYLSGSYAGPRLLEGTVASGAAVLTTEPSSVIFACHEGSRYCVLRLGSQMVLLTEAQVARLFLLDYAKKNECVMRCPLVLLGHRERLVGGICTTADALQPTVVLETGNRDYPFRTAVFVRDGPTNLVTAFPWPDA